MKMTSHISLLQLVRLKGFVLLCALLTGSQLIGQALPPGWGQDTTMQQPVAPPPQTLEPGELQPPTPAVEQVQPPPSFAETTTTAIPPPPDRATGVTEDMGKYMGFENVLERYLSMPYDAVMNTNLAESFVHLGYLLLIFLPLLLLFQRTASPWIQLAVMLFLTLLLIVSAGSSFTQRQGVAPEQAMATLDQQMQADEGKPLDQLGHVLRKPLLAAFAPLGEAMRTVSGPRDGVTYPVLCGIFLVMLFYVERRLRGHGLLLRATIHFTLLYAFLWLLLSSGIPWYGLLMLPLGYVFVVRGMVHDQAWDKVNGKLRMGLLVTFVGIWLIMFFPSRFCGFFPISEISARMPFSTSISQYQVGRATAADVLNTNFPLFAQASRVINADREGLVYRIGTYLPFFIRENDQRVFSDVFLDFFRQLQVTYPDRNTLTDVLRAYGFRYILVDVNTAGGDKTREQTLKSKYNSFLQYLYQNPRLELVATDRQVRLQSDGRLINAYGVYVPHTVEFPGTFAAYRIN